MQTATIVQEIISSLMESPLYVELPVEDRDDLVKRNTQTFLGSSENASPVKA